MIAHLLAAWLAGAAPTDATPDPTTEGGAVSDGRYLMGTVLEVTVHGDRAALDAVFDRVAELEARLSSWKPQSDVSRLNAAAGTGPLRLHPDALRTLGACLAYRELSRGTFDVTVGPLVALWRLAGETGRRPAPDLLAQTRARVGRGALVVEAETGTAELAAGSAVDLGGIAKGTATDAAIELLRGAGVERALVSFGQSSLHGLGAPPGETGWRVLLRDGAGGFVGVATLRDRALSVSSSLGAFVEIDGARYGHVIDPRSGEPLRELRSSAVVAPSGELAEALSNALLVLDEGEALEVLGALDGVEGLLVRADGSLRSTPGFEAMVLFEPLAQEPE